MLYSVKVYKPVLDVGHIYLSEKNKTAHHSLDLILGMENYQQSGSHVEAVTMWPPRCFFSNSQRPGEFRINRG